MMMPSQPELKENNIISIEILEDDFSGASTLASSADRTDDIDIIHVPAPPPPIIQSYHRSPGPIFDSMRKRLSTIVSPDTITSFQEANTEDSTKRTSLIDREMMAQNIRKREEFVVSVDNLVVRDIPFLTLSENTFNNLRFICDGTFSHIYTAMIKSSLLDEKTCQSLLENARPKSSCLGNMFRRARTSDEIFVIVKKIKNECFVNLRSVEDFEAEMKILRSLNHPHIVRIVGHGLDKDDDTQNKIAGASSDGKFKLPLYQGEGPPRPFLIVEALGGGTLSKYLAKQRSFHSLPFRLDHLLSLSQQLADGLNHIHYEIPGVSIIHRDLKPDNIGFAGSGALKILDFGLSIAVKRDDDGNNNQPYKMTGLTGSMRYMAPEVGLCKPYTAKCDVYSFALILYEMATGVQPYGGGLSKNAFIRNVYTAGMRPPLDIDDYGRRVKLPEDVKQLVMKCWEDVPLNRLSSKDIYNFLLARK